MSDMRLYETYYGIHTEDWSENFGTFSNHHKILVKDYLNEGCNCTDVSTASSVHEFLLPQALKKVYFIEGVIEGHVTFAASESTAYLCSYRATICKMNPETADTELFSTGWVSVNRTIAWHTVPVEVGDEYVFPFWINAMEQQELGENDRIFLRIEAQCSCDDTFVTCEDSDCTNLVLYHGNDSEWEGVKVIIPFLGV
jgi:hypothetical protein